MKFAEWVAENPDKDKYALAERAMSEFPDIIVPAIVDRIENIRRAILRAEEDEKIAAFLRSATPQASLEQASRRLSLPSEEFAVGDGTRASWGQATEEQHRKCAAMLRAMALGTLVTAKRHEDAADMIRASNARCLDEIPEEVSAA